MAWITISSSVKWCIVSISLTLNLCAIFPTIHLPAGTAGGNIYIHHSHRNSRWTKIYTVSELGISSLLVNKIHYHKLLGLFLTFEYNSTNLSILCRPTHFSSPDPLVTSTSCPPLCCADVDINLSSFGTSIVIKSFHS